jgi:hypothetical protein
MHTGVLHRHACGNSNGNATAAPHRNMYDTAAIAMSAGPSHRQYTTTCIPLGLANDFNDASTGHQRDGA